MGDCRFSAHAYEMLSERNIREDWVTLTLEAPQTMESKADGTVHYVRAIAEHQGRWLRVVVNPDTSQQTIVTVFFDRRLRRES